jgi:hypothetical protein
MVVRHRIVFALSIVSLFSLAACGLDAGGIAVVEPPEATGAPASTDHGSSAGGAEDPHASARGSTSDDASTTADSGDAGALVDGATSPPPPPKGDSHGDHDD